MHFWSFWAKYCHFLHILSNARPKTNLNKVPRWVFRYVGNKTFDFSSKKRNFARNWHFWPLLAHLAPCCWVGWWLWRAGCISQDTYLLYSSSISSSNIGSSLFRISSSGKSSRGSSSSSNSNRSRSNSSSSGRVLLRQKLLLPCSRSNSHAFKDSWFHN